MIIHHVALAAEWEAARATGVYRRSTLRASLEEVGFVHASFAHQLAGTAARHYDGVREPLAWLVIDTDRLGSPVVVEPSTSGERFPHVQGPIELGAVIDVVPAAIVDGRLTVTAPSVSPR